MPRAKGEAKKKTQLNKLRETKKKRRIHQWPRAMREAMKWDRSTNYPERISLSLPFTSLEAISGSGSSSKPVASLEAIGRPVSLLSLSLRSRQSVELVLLLSLSLRSRQLVERTLLLRIASLEAIDGPDYSPSPLASLDAICCSDSSP